MSSPDAPLRLVAADPSVSSAAPNALRVLRGSCTATAAHRRYAMTRLRLVLLSMAIAALLLIGSASAALAADMGSKVVSITAEWEGAASN